VLGAAGEGPQPAPSRSRAAAKGKTARRIICGQHSETTGTLRGSG
jgi:hypothetical protein